MLDSFPPQLTENVLHLVIACFGGLVLLGLKCAEHFNRAEADKLAFGKYIGAYLFLLVTLPALGVGVTAIYLLNGDKISPFLAFQIGLTSPGIVQTIVTARANHLATTARRETTQDQ